MNGQVLGIDAKTLKAIEGHSTKIDYIPNEVHKDPLENDTFCLLSNKAFSVYKNWQKIADLDITQNLEKYFPSVAKPHLFQLNCMAISKDGKYTAIGANNQFIYLYENIRSGSSFDLQLVKVLDEGHTAPLSKLKFSPNGKFLASADFKNEILVWNMETLAIQWFNLVYHTSMVTEIEWLNDDSANGDILLASCSVDKNLIAWNLSQEKRTIEIAHPTGVMSMALTKKDVANKTFEVVTGGKDNSLKLYELKFT